MRTRRYAGQQDADLVDLESRICLNIFILRHQYSKGTSTRTRTRPFCKPLLFFTCRCTCRLNLRVPVHVSLLKLSNIKIVNVSYFISLILCYRSIIANEGAVGLFKGLGPNLVGVAPSRAIYFFTYANMKMFMNERSTNPDSHVVHSLSAVAAGFVSCTVTNPIWFIKTRLQLDQKKENSLTCRQCIQRVYRADGIRGFWKGITASYVGIAETVVHFVIYEYLKAELLSLNNLDSNNSSDTKYLDFVKCMFAAACSKTCATLVAYPHEVARTRLREEGTKYRNFVQTIRLVYKEEKWKGLYRGITTQLLRQIPNTAILMATYELVVYLYQKSHEDSR
ncbi:hypothetical protein FSP39_023268 [Pinctada imbricata]|uniref:Solute carrier family 25 member 36-A n=1 Tax=Pinctada imbricata TaxID=66713 RepID=A0AA89C489_PINIB|nr:hypothetical protein FSP39_023268 [Pinctada imbricata]